MRTAVQAVWVRVAEETQTWLGCARCVPLEPDVPPTRQLASHPLCCVRTRAGQRGAPA